MSLLAEKIPARTERAVLRNLLAETLAAYEAGLGSGAATPAAGTGTDSGIYRRPTIGSRRFGMADVKAENAILRHLLVATTRAYEERLDALQGEQELTRQLLLAVDEAVLLTDASGALIRLNRAAEELTGWNAAEARGRALRDVLRIVGAQDRRVALDLSPCLADGRQMVMRRSLRAVGRDGRTRAVTGRVAPLRGRRQQVLGAVLILKVDGG